MSDDFEDYSDDEARLSQRPGRAQASGQGDGDTGGYKMKGALKAPRPTSYTTQALFDQMIAGDIDTDPDYQRDVVWPEHKQMGLIDSIFRNFYVPPLIFAVTYRDDGSERRTSIDGKQRLTSIRRFMQGEIMYKDPNTGEKFVFEDVGMFSGTKLLPERYRKIFRAKQIVCIEYQDLTNANEREIFQRVQLGMALTPAEKLQAITSPTSDFIHELRSKYVSPSDEAGLSSLLEWDIARGADFRCLVHAVYSILRWPNLLTFPSVGGLTKWVEREEELEPKLIAGVHQTMEIFVMLARDSKGHAFKMVDVKKVAPAEFIAIVVLIHVWKSKLGPSALKKAIRDMRRSVRDQEHDIRTNKRVMELLWTFIREMNGDAYRKPDENPATKLRPLKRKRRDDDEMSVDSEERRPPSRRRVVPKKEDDTMPTVSQAHAMASRRKPASSTRPSASSTPASPPQEETSASQLPSNSAPATQLFDVTPTPRNRLAALHAARQFGQDVPSSQSGSPRPAPHVPAPSFSSSAGPPPLLSQPPSGQSADEQKARLAAQELISKGSAAWPSTVQYPKPPGQLQASQQQAYRY